MEKRDDTGEDTSTSGRTVTAQHRERISVSRSQGRAVNEMVNLVRIESNGEGRRTSMTVAEIDASLADAQDQVMAATGVNAAKAAQRILELTQARSVAERMPDADAVRIAFHEAAGEWSKRNGVTWAAWKLLGLSDTDLAAAGIPKG